MWQAYKKYFIVLGFLGFLAVLFLLGGFLLSQGQKTPPSNPPFRQPPPEVVKESPYTITETNIGKSRINVTQPITLTFSKALSSNTVTITVTPTTIVNTVIAFNKLSLLPVSGTWNFNQTYTITIQGTQKEKEKSLDKPYTASFTTVPFSGM